MNMLPYVFDVDQVAKIRSELSITVREKKKVKKSVLSDRHLENHFQLEK